jgi:hypothetical protein
LRERGDHAASASSYRGGIHRRALADSLVCLAAPWSCATRPNLPHKSVRCRPTRHLVTGSMISASFGRPGCLICSAEGRPYRPSAWRSFCSLCRHRRSSAAVPGPTRAKPITDQKGWRQALPAPVWSTKSRMSRRCPPCFWQIMLFSWRPPPPIETPASASDFCAAVIGPAQSCAVAGQAKVARVATTTEAAKVISRTGFTAQHFVACVAPELGGNDPSRRDFQATACAR